MREDKMYNPFPHAINTLTSTNVKLMAKKSAEELGPEATHQIAAWEPRDELKVW